ncbi:hypothetical protein WUBG_14936, partial [Wuchereria bancrofti]
IPTTSHRLSSTSGQYKKRLLQKYEKEQEDKKVQKRRSNQYASFINNTLSCPTNVQTTVSLIEGTKELEKKNAIWLLNNEKTIDDSSSKSVECQLKQPLLSAAEPFGSQQQFNVWMQHQLLTWRNHWYQNANALSSIRSPAIIGMGGACLLAEPRDHMSRGMTRSTNSPEMESNFGPIR